MKSCTVTADGHWLAGCLIPRSPEHPVIFYVDEDTPADLPGREMTRAEAIVHLGNILGQCDYPVVRSNAHGIKVTVYNGVVHEYGW